MAGSAIKAQQLGMPYGTAMNRLRKIVLFSLLVKYGDDICSICGAQIESSDDLSMEHIIPWLHSNDPAALFWDLTNIAFSHLLCNNGARRYITPLRREASIANLRKVSSSNGKTPVS